MMPQNQRKYHKERLKIVKNQNAKRQRGGGGGLVVWFLGLEHKFPGSSPTAATKSLGSFSVDGCLSACGLTVSDLLTIWRIPSTDECRGCSYIP